jgi:hypothetical protein
MRRGDVLTWHRTSLMVPDRLNSSEYHFSCTENHLLSRTNKSFDSTGALIDPFALGRDPPVPYGMRYAPAQGLHFSLL